MHNEILHKEIDLIQNCINRMANNSFLLKGWIISLVSIVLALKIDEICLKHHWFIFVSVLLFWLLDAYFLRLEWLYRELYSWVIEERINNNQEFLYDLNPHRFDDKVCYLSVVFSAPLLTFYLGLFLMLIAVFLR